MSARNLLSLAVGIMLLALTTMAWSAAAPSKLSYQAVLQNAVGQPVTTQVTVVFTIYDASSGGNTLWTETRNLTPDAAGRVNVLLGDNTPVGETVFDGPNRWLGIQVGADPEMPQRTQLAASAYSRRVSTVDGALGGNLEGDLTLHSTAASEKDAQAVLAQLTLISLSNDTIVVGPANQVVFRAVDPTGAERMSAVVTGPNGPALGIRDAGGNRTEHTGAASSYFSGVTKDANAEVKNVEIGADGVTVFNPDGSVMMRVNPGTGQIAATSINIAPDLGAVANKDAAAVCGANALSDLGTTSQLNNAFGADNDLSGASSSISVGSCNTIDNTVAPAGHYIQNCTALGEGNFVGSNQSFVSGYKNFVDMGSSQITIFGSEDTISTDGGLQSSVGSSILGGQKNFIIGPVNTIISGNGNRINRNGAGTIQTCNNTTIAGGNLNRVSGSSFSFIAGGERNIIDIDSNGSVPFNHGVIGGGADNVVSKDGSTIAGGYNNWARGAFAAVGGGNTNKVTGDASTIGGGSSNTAGPQNGAVVAGGQTNLASGQWAAVGGGIGNIASGPRSTVGGGSGNNVAASMSAVSGGIENAITSSGDSSFIGGGYANSVTGKISVVVGGRGNSNIGFGSSIGGGLNNSVAGGGSGYVTVAGGSNNSITSSAGGNFGSTVSTIGGGYSNAISDGYAATIPGGYDNSANGDYSFASGRRAQANNNGAFVWADANDFDFPAAGEVNFTPGANNLLARATGGAIIVTGVDGTGKSTSGVVVPAGSGSWAVLSDKNAKENVRPINTAEVLNKIAQLDIASWNYQAQDDAIRHIGPMAQDLYAAFGYGEDERHISSVDADGIALAAIQALHKKTQELESQKTEIDALRDEIAELKQLVELMAKQR